MINGIRFAFLLGSGVLLAGQLPQGSMTATQRSVIEKAVAERHAQTVQDAERLDLNRAIESMVETDKGAFIRDGELIMTSKEVYETFKEAYAGLDKQDIEVGRQNVIVLAPDIAILVGEGRSTSTTKDGRTFSCGTSTRKRAGSPGAEFFGLAGTDVSKKEVIACGNDGTVRVFNGTNGELLWHQRFSDKIRCIARLNSVKGPIISCGGDDRLLHLIDKNAKKEIEFLEFEDYVWKALSFPYAQYEKIIVSTYSFAYFNESLPIDKIDFSSKIVCIDKNLEVSWEICGKNAEYLNAFEKNGRSIALIGTTSGEILMIDSNTGKILLENKKNACINMVQGLSNKNLIVSCNDDGQIIAYLIEII